MIEHSDRPGLALKETCRIGVRIFSLNDLNGDLPSQLLILREVDFAHTSTSEQTEQAESTEI